MPDSHNTPDPQTRRPRWLLPVLGAIAVLLILLWLLSGDNGADTVDDPGLETGAVGTDAEDSRPEAEPAPGGEENTGVPEDGEAEVEGD
ncbi:hypothetical protein [Roseobacter sp. HKCCA0434]|uniref:hypothetical protein n=1 Tax=Roseobacter sp. HKCCA0434 TaxID=3079297 RepID=UPI002905C90F|nr:hypothetical protein [Roseobacter sp. HKCCA0434]